MVLRVEACVAAVKEIDRTDGRSRASRRSTPASRGSPPLRRSPHRAPL